MQLILKNNTWQLTLFQDALCMLLLDSRQEYADLDSSAFSTVVADNQFSTLGIVLLAALARLAKITGISHEMRKPAAIKAKNDNSVAREDLGERVRRPDDSLSCSTQTSRPGDTEASIPKKAKEKNRSISKIGKSKKKKNAIDDLFSGLL